MYHLPPFLSENSAPMNRFDSGHGIYLIEKKRDFLHMIATPPFPVLYEVPMPCTGFNEAVEIAMNRI